MILDDIFECTCGSLVCPSWTPGLPRHCAHWTSVLGCCIDTDSNTRQKDSQSLFLSCYTHAPHSPPSLPLLSQLISNLIHLVFMPKNLEIISLLFLFCQICLVLSFAFLLSDVPFLPNSVGLAQLLIKVRAHTAELICRYPLPTQQLTPKRVHSIPIHSSHFLAFCFSSIKSWIWRELYYTPGPQCLL